MTHSFRSHYYHLIWSTKNRQPLITKSLKMPLYGYIGNIIKHYDGALLAAGGVADHIHLLVGLNLPDKFSGFIRDIKANSSAWLNRNFDSDKHFNWQEGYGSFSVSYSSLERVQDYIKNQEEHHKQATFEDEYLKLLKIHHIPYDERFILG